MPFLLYIAALMKRKKEKSIQKKSFPEVTASRVKPEKQEGLHLVRKKETIRGKNKQRKKPDEMSPHHIESVSAVENQCSRIPFL